MAQWNKDAQAFRAQDTTNFEVVMIADEDGNPINSFGAASNIPIAAGLISGYSHINKFGYRASFASTYQAIWDGTTAYPYIGTAGGATATSGSTDDAGAVITVSGLDENYAPASEDITVGGAAGAVNFIRVFRAFVKTPATGETTNVGLITITVDGAGRAFIKAEAGQTLMSVYTIPAGKTGYLMKLQCSVDKLKDGIFRLIARPFGGAFNTKAQLGTFATPINYDYPVPLRFTEKTDLEVQAISGNTLGGGATFDLILVDN